jgi:hypothetical protein
MLGSDIRRNYRRGLCFAQGELLPEAHGTEANLSSMILPTRGATSDPNCGFIQFTYTTSGRQITYEL